LCFLADLQLEEEANNKMSWLDLVPGVAHVKAAAQYVTGDNEGASRTMERFVTKTPVVSHFTAGVAKVCGDDKLAKECWSGGNSSLDALPVVGHAKGLGHYAFGDIKGGNRAMKDATSTSMNMADNVPVLGHAKGVVHYAVGDKEGCKRAMKSVTRTTAVMGAGAGGFLVAGPAGAAVAGIGAGAEWDLATAALTDGEELNGICKVIDNPKKVDSYFDAGVTLAGDALTGYSGGKMAERVIKASEIRTADNLRTLREEKGLPRNGNVASGKNGREIFSEVKDTSTGKTYNGVNESVRNRYGDAAPRPNQFLQQNSDIQPPMARNQASCAEAQALHKYVVDKQGPNVSTVNTRINTLEVRPNGDIYTMPRCDNCISYKAVVGRCNTDVVVSQYYSNE
jgi:hypothetical protein